MLTRGQILVFLKRLAALAEETGITISGCGCCGSPSLDAITPGVARPVAYYCDDDGGNVRTRAGLSGNLDLDTHYAEYWQEAGIRSTDDE